MSGLQISLIVLILVCMLVCFALVSVIGGKVTEESRQVRKREEFIVGKQEETKKEEKTEKDSKDKKKSVNSKSQYAILLEKLAEKLAKSDILMKPEEFLMIWIGITLIPGLLSFLFIHNEVLAPMLMVVGGILPILFMNNKQKKRKTAFENQLSDALMIASNCIKSGLTFSQAMETISEECEDPIRSEFKRTVNEITFGSSQDDALEAMAKRVKSADFDLVVSAVSVQRQTGGNLSEILDIISGTIRQRIKIKAEIKSMTGQGRMSGIIIGALPVVLLLVMTVLNKDLIMLFFNTTIGNALLVLSVVLECLGAFFINKIVTIKF